MISDIDDTVKVADVSSGIKKIFNNVFVKGLEELIVPGMGTFYQRLYRKGVRFHYVVSRPPESDNLAYTVSPTRRMGCSRLLQNSCK